MPHVVLFVVCVRPQRRTTLRMRSQAAAASRARSRRMLWPSCQSTSSWPPPPARSSCACRRRAASSRVRAMGLQRCHGAAAMPVLHPAGISCQARLTQCPLKEDWWLSSYRVWVVGLACPWLMPQTFFSQLHQYVRLSAQLNWGIWIRTRNTELKCLSYSCRALSRSVANPVMRRLSFMLVCIWTAPPSPALIRKPRGFGHLAASCCAWSAGTPRPGARKAALSGWPAWCRSSQGCLVRLTRSSQGCLVRLTSPTPAAGSQLGLSSAEASRPVPALPSWRTPQTSLLVSSSGAQ